MKATTILTLVIALIAFPQIHAQEAPPKPAELKVLERWVGNGTLEVTGKPAVWEPEGSQREGIRRADLVLDGRFLYTTVKAKGKPGKYEFIALRNYDQNKKAYRSWSFGITDKSSLTSESSGQWDEDTKTMTDIGVDADREITANSKMTFIDKDRFDFTLVVKDREGKVLLDRHGTVREKKANGSKVDQEQQAQPKSPELKVLDRYLGTWNTETVKKVAEWNPKEVRTTGTVTNEWVLDGRFMQQRGKESNGLEHIQMRTYDPQQKQFRLWHFDSKGGVVNSNGTWDEDAKTMTWKADSGKSITGTNAVRFVGDDTIEWRVLVRNDAGKVFMDMEGKFKRRK